MPESKGKRKIKCDGVNGYIAFSMMLRNFRFLTVGLFGSFPIAVPHFGLRINQFGEGYAYCRREPTEHREPWVGCFVEELPR